MLRIERWLRLDQLSFCVQLFVRLFQFVGNFTEAGAKAIMPVVKGGLPVASFQGTSRRGGGTFTNQPLRQGGK